jgi:hypothetical protein
MKGEWIGSSPKVPHRKRKEGGGVWALIVAVEGAATVGHQSGKSRWAHARGGVWVWGGFSKPGQGRRKMGSAQAA